MLGRNGKRELSDTIWKWICRALVVFLTLGWYFRGTDPSERWIGLIVILLGLNEWRAKIGGDRDERSYNLSLRKVKEVPKQTDHSGSEPPTLFVDRGFVVA